MPPQWHSNNINNINNNQVDSLANRRETECRKVRNFKFSPTLIFTKAKI